MFCVRRLKLFGISLVLPANNLIADKSQVGGIFIFASVSLFRYGVLSPVF